MNVLNDWQTAISVDVIAQPDPNWSEDKLEKNLKTAIKTCTEWCMSYNKDGWIFTTLSGLDSSLCLAIIRQLFPKATICTYTIGGNDQHPDILHARIISRLLRTNHFEVIPEANKSSWIEFQWRCSFFDAFPEVKFQVKPPTKGDIAVYTIYRAMAFDGANAVIAHDGVDELLGGYWAHRGNNGPHQEDIFKDLWKRLAPEHLELLQRDADHFGIKLLLPYLQLPVIKYISGIPVHLRTSHDESKIPLRNIARKYLPPEIIERKKVGFCSGLDKF